MNQFAVCKLVKRKRITKITGLSIVNYIQYLLVFLQSYYVVKTLNNTLARQVYLIFQLYNIKKLSIVSNTLNSKMCFVNYICLTSSLIKHFK